MYTSDDPDRVANAGSSIGVVFRRAYARDADPIPYSDAHKHPSDKIADGAF